MLNGIKRAYTLLILFLIEVIEAQGTDISLKMLQNAIEKQADIPHMSRFAVRDSGQTVAAGMCIDMVEKQMK